MKSIFKLASLSQRLMCKYSSSSITTTDISSEMLISLSMGHGFDKCKNHQELCKNLKQQSILSSPVTYKVFEQLDRKLFINSTKNNIYQNIPQNIGSGQNMTSPLMHAVALENMLPTLESALLNDKVQKLELLDVGTGSGYISFALYLMAQELIKQEKYQKSRSKEIRITGIDIFEDLVKQCNQLQSKLWANQLIMNQHHSSSVQVKFQKMDMEQALSGNSNQGKYNIVHCGAACDKKFKPIFVSALNQEAGTFIYPEIQQDGEQNLMIIEKKQGKTSENILMKCMYSLIMDREKMELNKYFVQNEVDQKIEDESERKNVKATTVSGDEEAKDQKQEEDIGALAQIKQQQLVCKTAMELLKQKLKVWQENFKTQNKRRPNLDEMNKNIEAKKLLDDISLMSRKLIKLNNLEKVNTKKK